MLLLLIILSCGLAFILSLRFNSDVEEKFLTVTVSEGDSLWEYLESIFGSAFITQITNLLAGLNSIMK